jgi:hypothetical protein
LFVLCDDLQVLGKQEFKLLLKWRLHIRKDLSPQLKDDSGMDKVKETVEGDDDERMLSQMEELHFIYEQKNLEHHSQRSTKSLLSSLLCPKEILTGNKQGRMLQFCTGPRFIVHNLLRCITSVEDLKEIEDC